MRARAWFRLFWMFFACYGALMATDKPQTVPPVGGLTLLSEWLKVQDTVTARGLFTPQAGEPGIAPVEWRDVQGGGYVMMPVNFKGTTHRRVSWDLPVKADFSKASAIVFDLYCPQPEVFSHMSIYFHSGSGWYAASFGLEEINDWNRIVIKKASTRTESAPAGWGAIDTIRISGWRQRSDADTWMALANLGSVVQNAEILVVRADSNAAKGGSEAKSYTTYANSMMSSLERAHVPAMMMADNDVTAQTLQDKKLVILPYNGTLPSTFAKLLPDFLARGGKIIVCYTASAELLSLLGLKNAIPSWLKAPGGSFHGFSATEQRLELQPDFARQSSHNARIVKPADAQGKVIAVWRGSDGRDTDLPAIVVTQRGAFVGHVWKTDGGVDKVRLLQAILSQFVTLDFADGLRQRHEMLWKRGDVRTEKALREAVAATTNVSAKTALAQADAHLSQYEAKMEARDWRGAEKALEQAETAVSEAFFRLQQPKKGEFRGIWCHSAFGVSGHDWETAVRHLSEQGFTAIFPNMCWGGIAFYPSEVLPSYSELELRGDQVQKCLDACLKYGIECHVWKVNWNMGRHASKAHCEAMAKAGRTQVDRQGKMQERWLCPSHPLNQKLEIEAMVELAVRYPRLTGIHYDYIRFPNAGNCFCAGCRQRFEQTLGRTLAAWPFDHQDAGLLAAWQQFRRDQIDLVVRGVRERLDELQSKIQVSAAVFPNWASDRDSIGQDWRKWCEKGWVDFVCPMDYTPHLVSFRAQVQAQTQWVKPEMLAPGIGMSCWPNAADAAKIVQQIQVTRQARTRGFMIFDYDRQAYENLSWLGLGCTKK